MMSISHARRARFGAPGAGRRSPFSRAEGETLVELLMTIVILGLAIVALVTAMLAVIVTSNSHRRRVKAANELTTISEKIQGMDYVPCASTSTYASAYSGITADNFTPSIDSVGWLADKNAATPAFNKPTCATAADDLGLQQITISINSPKQTPVTETLVIIKRDDRCVGLSVAAGTKC